MLDGVVVGGSIEPWQTLGFAGGERIELANGAIVIDDDARPGAVALRVVSSSHVIGDVVDVDGLMCDVVEGLDGLDDGDAGELDHPNGAIELDHVVVLTDSIDRTSAAIVDQLELPLKRIREVGDVRQGFHRFADVGTTRGCIVEVVERSDVRRPALWGFVVTVPMLDERLARFAGGAIGEARDAVQPGRRIATVSRRAGLGMAVAFMTP